MYSLTAASDVLSIDDLEPSLAALLGDNLHCLGDVRLFTAGRGESPTLGIEFGAPAPGEFTGRQILDAQQQLQLEL